ncbi:SIS domain-containing protein [Treponema sp. OttesenSCG-928-L16]|nr:SIS domain-containing protein [Treponema sp. OttesenSCG-928-L16]
MKDLMKQFLVIVTEHLSNIEKTQHEEVSKAAGIMADRIAEDKPVYVFGPGGHSNLGTMEVFFRAGGLMHINPILDEGTLLSSGALRSMAIERLPGYGRIVMEKSGFSKDDVLILVNAYGINSAVIDSALYCKEAGGTLIGVSSRRHASNTAADHPARHPTKKNLCDIADVLLDCDVPIGDAMVQIDGVEQKAGAISTFANAYLLNCLVLETIQILADRGIVPPIWRSGNAPGGDEWNNQFIHRFTGRIKHL